MLGILVAMNVPLTSLSLSPEILTISIWGVCAIALLELIWIVLLERRIHRLMRGKSGASLEETIGHILGQHDDFKEFQKDMAHALSVVDARLRTAARGVGTVRFDAFSGDGSGGRQSFATALLSENGDGVVISSLHARASTRIFAKPVRAFESENELTEEERSAIESARAGTSL